MDFSMQFKFLSSWYRLLLWNNTTLVYCGTTGLDYWAGFHRGVFVWGGGGGGGGGGDYATENFQPLL